MRMPLSEDDQRRLDEIEQALTKDDQSSQGSVVLVGVGQALSSTTKSCCVARVSLWATAAFS